MIAPPSNAPHPKPVRQAVQPQSSGYSSNIGVKRPHPASSSSTSSSSPRANTAKLVSFVLRRHPKEVNVSRLEREYIRTSCELKIEHLKKFLGIKLSYERFERFQIVIIPDGKKGIVLDESLTLENVRTKLLDSRSGEFVLHFQVVGETQGSNAGVRS